MQTRKVWESFKPRKKSWLLVRKWGIAILCIIWVFALIHPYADHIKSFFSSAGKNVVKVVSKTVGTEMKKDSYWNVNIALIWYGGSTHGGGYLSDTMIVASRNPEKWAVSMISIPRDLYVKNPLWGASRINAVFTQLYSHHKRDLHLAAQDFLKMLEKVTGLEINYYATIDFSGFKKVIDTLWGIEVNVPSALHDYQYPDEHLRGYDPLHVEAWWQTMDWALALKYARSRHAAGHASDFDRSLRQQLVIDALKNKLVASWVSLDRATQLYNNLTEMVTTNVKLDEMLRTVQFLDGLKTFSFGINNSYTPTNFQTMQKWAFVYNPPRDLVWGASVLVPYWGSVVNLDQYSMIHEYVDFVSHLQKFLVEKPTIEIVNGIDKEQLRAKKLQNTKIASILAAKMKRYGLEVKQVSNADPQELNQIVVNISGAEAKGFEGTITAIKNFLPIDQVTYNTWVIKSIIDDYGNEVIVFTWSDVEIKLGNNYLSGFKYPLPETLNIQYRD